MYSGKHEHMTPAQQAAQDERAQEDLRHGSFQATQYSTAPLSDFMTRLVAEEIPMLDSASRQRVHELLRAYDGPIIETQEQLPAQIRQLLDLD
ncbi:hypothetical protein G7Y31_00480 [Corynebacterium lizhenjunii]|uniref:Uncharacterized protein n=1 Tax=Corynebacterium lizhenjunii TaxID=2709394 RepID=A0A7T0KEC9_9CORY|nr:hypothetical protein [Corynebacterium lizhenjunii]QPK79251.1 hypothetical protein G7Y31_00480 [Corynebacterium lizhenjunii]